jgi:hypothetical protein
MIKTKIISVDDITTAPGVLVPSHSDYVVISDQSIKALHPQPIPKAFRIVWSDRIKGNTQRDDGITYVHVFVQQFQSNWSVFIQAEAGWQRFIKTKQEVKALLLFIASQTYAIDPKPSMNGVHNGQN